LTSEIAAREQEVRRLTGEIGRREQELEKMHVVNHVDMREIKG
jgi:hypothetical protein